MGLMNAFDSQTEDSSPAIGRNLRSRPLARKKLSEMVEEELEQMIRRREFGEGEQLPSERELMAFFNVGRPSVREALAALKRKGLVQINNGERARVSRPSADTIIGELSGMAKDFLSHPGGIAHFEQLRLFFESSLVRYAAEHATDEQIDLLAKALEINSQSLDNNAAFIRSDVDFHRVLAEIPGRGERGENNSPALLHQLLGQRLQFWQIFFIYRSKRFAAQRHRNDIHIMQDSFQAAEYARFDQ
jgi:GntR family transcriptional regulator, sialic acid-inducible nan operon repressor